MLNRRELLKLSGAATVVALFPGISIMADTKPKGPFRFCLNTSTIMGQNPGLLSAIEIAAKAGYDGMELWVNDIKDYLKQGSSIQSLATALSAKGIVAENLVSFTAWMVDDDTKRKAALAELEEEMKMMAALGAEVGEPGSLERPENLSPCDSSQTAHTSTATRWTPTNSGPAMLVPSTSRHSSMASLMRLRSLSSERACVWQPCNSGTLAT